MKSTSLSRPNTRAVARWLAVAAFCSWGSPLHAQIASQPVPAPVQLEPQKLNQAELAQLLAPIALYPDALIALILPASTVPSDVVLGARYLQGKGNPDLVGNQPWDESVKSLVRYPEVLAWMDQNLEWTASVGEAFVEQPADVMNSIQALREQARAAGNLQDTPQQRVVVEEEIIRIVPADPLVIYVPQYDPEIVYVQSYYSGPLLTFGIGFAVGSWLNYDFDWNRRCIYRGNWRGWNHEWNNHHGSHGNQANVVNIDINNANQWQPSANGQRQTIQRQRNSNGNARYVGAQAPGQQAAGLNASSRVPQPGFALPRPSRLPVSAGGSLPGSTGNPAAGLPSNPAAINPLPGTPDGRNRSDRPRTQNPENLLVPTVTPGLPGAAGTPDASSGQQRRIRTVPSAPPQVPVQMNNPARNQTKESRRSEHPNQPLIPTSAPQSGNVPASLPPQVAPAGERVKMQVQPGSGDSSHAEHTERNRLQVQPTDNNRGFRNVTPSVGQPAIQQPPPAIQQPQQERRQVQWQQPQERRQPQPPQLQQIPPQRQQLQQGQPQRQQPQGPSANSPGNVQPLPGAQPDRGGRRNRD